MVGARLSKSNERCVYMYVCLSSMLCHARKDFYPIST